MGVVVERDTHSKSEILTGTVPIMQSLFIFPMKCISFQAGDMLQELNPSSSGVKLLRNWWHWYFMVSTRRSSHDEWISTQQASFGRK
jgi:hypothetical protein